MILKTKLINSNFYCIPIILLHFSITYAFEDIYVYCSYTVEVPCKCIHIQWHHIRSLTSASMEIFILPKIVEATNKDCLPRDPVVKYLPAHVLCLSIWHIWNNLPSSSKPNTAIFSSSTRTMSFLSVEPQMKYLASILRSCCLKNVYLKTYESHSGQWTEVSSTHWERHGTETHSGTHRVMFPIRSWMGSLYRMDKVNCHFTFYFYFALSFFYCFVVFKCIKLKVHKLCKWYNTTKLYFTIFKACI